MRRLTFLNTRERQQYEERWTASVLADAATYLRASADVVSKDKDAVIFLSPKNYTRECAYDVLWCVIRSFPYPQYPHRDGRVIARKMRRAARRAEYLARHKRRAVS